jgi:hypothetical protein
LRVFPYPANTVVPPAVVVGWPAPITPDTLARGGESITFPVLVAVGKADIQSARDALGAYLDGSDPAGVPRALERGTYTACDAVRVTEKRVEPVSIAGIEYLAAVLDVQVTGTGGQ